MIVKVVIILLVGDQFITQVDVYV